MRVHVFVCVSVYLRVYLSVCLYVFYLRDAGAAGNHGRCAVPSGNRARVFVRQNKYSLFIGVISFSINYIRGRADTVRVFGLTTLACDLFLYTRTADTRVAASPLLTRTITSLSGERCNGD